MNSESIDNVTCSMLYKLRMRNGEEEEENMYEYSASMANLYVLGSETKLNKSKILGVIL